MFPKQTYLSTMSQMKSASEEDEDDEQLDSKSLMLKYNRDLVAAGQFDKEFQARLITQMFMVQDKQITAQQTWILDLMKQQKETFSEFLAALRRGEEALSAAEERKIRNMWAQMKIDMAKDGLRTARNLLPQLFGASDKPPAMNGHTNGAPANGTSNGAANGAAAKEDMVVRKTKEQILVENFLVDCEQTGVLTKLFGEWKEDEETGDVNLVTPGIFSRDQCAIFIQVRDGQLPAEALDALMPGSNDPNMITLQQVEKAQAFLTDGTGAALVELITLRKQAAAEKAAASSAQAAAPTAPAKNPIKEG
jgi:hypothetical protein